MTMINVVVVVVVALVVMVDVAPSWTRVRESTFRSVSPNGTTISGRSLRT